MRFAIATAPEVKVDYMESNDTPQQFKTVAATASASQQNDTSCSKQDKNDEAAEHLEVTSALEKAMKAYDDFLSNEDLCDDQQGAAVFQVYEDLRRVRCWSDLRVHRTSLGQPFLTGVAPPMHDSVFPGLGTELEANEQAREVVDRTQAVVPVEAAATLSASWLSGLGRQVLPPGRTDALRCVTLAVVDEDSTTAYYRILTSWSEIVHPQWKRIRRRRKDDGTAAGTMAGTSATGGVAGGDGDVDGEDVTDDDENTDSD